VCGVLESAAYSTICEHLQKPHNAGSRHAARFFNTLLKDCIDFPEMIRPRDPVMRIDVWIQHVPATAANIRPLDGDDLDEPVKVIEIPSSSLQR
jgi:hypothetical protein